MMSKPSGAAASMWRSPLRGGRSGCNFDRVPPITQNERCRCARIWQQSAVSGFYLWSRERMGSAEWEGPHGCAGELHGGRGS